MSPFDARQEAAREYTRGLKAGRDEQAARISALESANNKIGKQLLDFSEEVNQRGERISALEAENARLRKALERQRQGFGNLLEFRHIAGTDRYGALTKEEIEQEIKLIDAALGRQA